MTDTPPPAPAESSAAARADSAVFASATDTLDALAALAARAARAAAATKSLEALEVRAAAATKSMETLEALAARADAVAASLATLEALASREARRAMTGAAGDAVVADALAQSDNMSLAFIRLIAAGYERKPAAMMALAVLSASPEARERGRAWCAEHMSTRDDPTGTNAAINLNLGTDPTKIVPSVPARRQ